MHTLNVKFILRGLVLAIPLAILLTLTGRLALLVGQPAEPTPLPPIILSARDTLPAGRVGLRAWARYQGEAYHLVGSGFLLQLDDGRLVGVTTAHSVSIGDPGRPLEQIALGLQDQTHLVVEFDTLHGHPGHARTDLDMAVDYVLLRPLQPIDASFVLEPDPRGGPQPGERVSLLTDMRAAESGRRILEGTVQSANDRAVWVLMDKLFNPALMSGSPVVSQHTGRAVGMLVAGTPRRNRLLLGLNPIGSIVELAGSADEFPRLVDYEP